MMLLEMKVFGLAVDPFTNAPIVILKDLDEKKTLPVWIGVMEASAIATELENVKFSRPLTHDLLRSILDQTGVSVTKVEVTDLKDNVYYANIFIDSHRGELTIDARPSDAIALALRMGSPIYVDTKVLDKSKSIDMRDDEGRKRSSSELMEMLDDLSPEDFGKYKM